MAGVQKTKIRWAIYLLLVMLYFYGMPSQAQYGGGTGEPNDPYLIYTAEQMNAIGTEPNDWNKHFKLMANIDLSAYTGTDFNIIGYWVDWSSPDNKPFAGVFDGNGSTISNFSCASTNEDCTGLFRYVTGVIKDLGLVDPNVDAGTANYVGLLVGWLVHGTITNCYVEGGSVLGEQRIGGIVGHNSGTIINCYANGSVTGYSDVGGMVGFNSGTISDCCASGSVRGYGHVGGLVGALGGLGRIIDSYATAGVLGEYEIGGLVGYISWGTIVNCCASGNVTGYECVGGMVGSIGYFPSSSLSFSPPPPPAKISNCYSTGDVTGNRMVGGLVGWLINGTIANCYSTGSVSGYGLIGGLLGVKASFIIWQGFLGITGDTISDFYSTANITGNSGVGQMIRGSIREVVNSFWDVESSGRATSAGGTGKTTVEMQTASTFLAAGWDFMGETKNGTEDIWWILEARAGRDYPRLWWEDAEQ